MELFNKKYVYCMGDDALDGKSCFVADNIQTLIDYVYYNNVTYKGIVTNRLDSDYPFMIRGTEFRFAYYDKNYEIKRAYNNGKQIQFKHFDGTWVDCVDMEDESWDDKSEYRIKPKTCERMRRRQLAEWLAKGNGELTWGSKAINSTALEYYSSKENEPVPDDYIIRRWGSDEWIIPTTDVYKEDCNEV